MRAKKYLVGGILMGMAAWPMGSVSGVLPMVAVQAAAQTGAVGDSTAGGLPAGAAQTGAGRGQTVAGNYSLELDTGKYTTKTLPVNGQAVAFRAYEDRVYVQHPADAQYESMNIYIPEGYFSGQTIHGYTARTAPIFLPNGVGGYMPGEAVQPGDDPMHGGSNAALVALSRGYVVAAPAIRGRTLQAADGSYTGKAPALLVDYKAAVRYLRYNKDRLPAGDTEKIISNGTSAGGALSALLGATGNSPDYEPYLQAVGAAQERDDIFASSDYCPITNLEHADMAYEWIFNGVNEYHQPAMGSMRGAGKPLMPGMLKVGDKVLPMGPGPVILPGMMGMENSPAAGKDSTAKDGARPANAPTETAAAQALSPLQVAASAELKEQFPAYVNSLQLKDAAGRPLTLDAQGNGSFRDYLESFYMASAQQALDSGKDLSGLDWLTIQQGRVTGMDLAKYAVYVTRLKAVPAFDSFDLSSGETNEFGTTAIAAQHFTDFSMKNSTVSSTRADERIVRLLNPMNYIGQSGVTSAKYWRIRHGAKDRDTALAIPLLLATSLANIGLQVDFASPWDRGHDGDYDLSELFSWMDVICIVCC